MAEKPADRVCRNASMALDTTLARPRPVSATEVPPEDWPRSWPEVARPVFAVSPLPPSSWPSPVTAIASGTGRGVDVPDGGAVGGCDLDLSGRPVIGIDKS